MSLKGNILASYISQAYVTLISMVMVPLYLKYMGVEAYGLVGFFAMVQAWFQLLDMGLTPTMSRETARYQGGATDALSLRRLLHALEWVFIGLAMVGALAMLLGADAITAYWLNVQRLSLAEVQASIGLMGVIVALRWVCGLYRGVINGFERLVWLSYFNIAIATARFVLVIPFFNLAGASPTKYFCYQLVVAVIEMAVLIAQTYHLMPRKPTGSLAPWEWAPLRKLVKFSLSIAFTGSVWVFVTQTDKLLLSKILPLSEYACFTLAVQIAYGSMVISGPITVALLPRMTRLNAEGDEAGLVWLYRKATQLVCAISTPVTLVLVLYPEQVLFAWTGDANIAGKAAPVLTLYALGNGFLSMAAFPYYLQYAKGDLKLHLVGNALFVTVLIPTLAWATWGYGMVGAGYVWLGTNAAFLLLWVPVVHRRFMKGRHASWLFNDICGTTGISVLLAGGSFLVTRSISGWPGERLLLALCLAGVSVILLLASVLSLSWMRTELVRRASALNPWAR